MSVTSGTRSFGQVQLTAIAPDESLRWQTLSVGHLPKADNEVVAFAGSNFAVGEHFYVRPDVDTGTDRVAREMTVVGLLDRASTTTSAPQLFGTNAGVAALAPGRAVDQAECRHPDVVHTGRRSGRGDVGDHPTRQCGAGRQGHDRR